MENLADRLRPTTLDDIIGQTHLIGKNKIINNLIKSKKIFSMILYGSPGIGKTTIATVIASELNLKYKFLNATINNKSDFDSAIKEAKLYGEMILIVDEIHRMNKDKQDLLLPYIESGLIILLGLTTSNPYYKINPAIRSRCHIFRLEELSIKDIITGLKKASNVLEKIVIDDESYNYIANISNGDYRYALSFLELAYYSFNKKITVDKLKTISNKPIMHGDFNGTGHYDMLSALQKSIRGSDVDASLHYLARLIIQGDIDSINRRLAVICYEDIGLANPQLATRLESAINLSLLVGLPEARIILGEIVIEMALSPKSNSAYLAIAGALNDCNLGNTGNIPSNIEYNNTTYIYPHDYPRDYVKQNYMPDKLIGKKYYIKKDNAIENNLNKAHALMKGIEK